MTTYIPPLETPLLECPVCGWLAYEGDEDRYCQEHNASMQLLVAGDKTGP